MFDEDERELMDLLTIHTTWAGRYPVPQNWSQLFDVDKDTITSVLRYDDADIDIATQFYQKVKERLVEFVGSELF
jgi:hypothetical protein